MINIILHGNEKNWYISNFFQINTGILDIKGGLLFEKMITIA